MVEWCYPVVVGTSPKRKKTCRMLRRSKHHHGKQTDDVVGVGNQSVTLDGQSSLPVFTGVPRRKKIVWLGRSSRKNDGHNRDIKLAVVGPTFKSRGCM